MVVFAFNVTLQVTVLDVVHPDHALNACVPADAGAVIVTDVPALYVRLKLALPFPAPLLSAGATVIETPVVGLVVFTVSTYVATAGGLLFDPPPLPPPHPFNAAIDPASTQVPAHRSKFFIIPAWI